MKSGRKREGEKDRRTEEEERSQAELLSLMKSHKCLMVYGCQCPMSALRERARNLRGNCFKRCPTELLKMSVVRPQ